MVSQFGHNSFIADMRGVSVKQSRMRPSALAKLNIAYEAAKRRAGHTMEARRQQRVLLARCVFTSAKVSIVVLLKL